MTWYAEDYQDWSEVTEELVVFWIYLEVYNVKRVKSCGRLGVCKLKLLSSM